MHTGRARYQQKGTHAVPTIKIDQIKPASDAVRQAIDKMRDIDADINAQSYKPADSARARNLAIAQGAARQEYEVALIALSNKVHDAIKQASAEQ
jgi:CHASE3 domain sensor protein